MGLIKPARGRRIPPSKMPGTAKSALPMCMAVVYRSLDQWEWEPILRDLVPEWVQEPGVMRSMLDGLIVQKEADGPYWYRAERVADKVTVYPAPDRMQ